uniref:Uncharacterized protein n=1 Tax=Myotis myotis TaxID=51298 RepID=A0A7J7RCK8_MYOMY|nr:hypothetical protein mMyoMyo1_010831 [Myotis myotis]
MPGFLSSSLQFLEIAPGFMGPSHHAGAETSGRYSGGGSTSDRCRTAHGPSLTLQLLTKGSLCQGRRSGLASESSLAGSGLWLRGETSCLKQLLGSRMRPLLSDRPTPPPSQASSVLASSPLSALGVRPHPGLPACPALPPACCPRDVHSLLPGRWPRPCL